MERGGLVGLAHVAGPFGMEEVLALFVGLLRFRRFVPLVAGIEMPFEHVLGFGDRPGIHGARLDDVDGAALNGAGRADLVAALRQNHVVEARTGHERAGRRHPEAHRQRDGLVVFVVLGLNLPHVRARRRLERADVAPPEIHPVVADVAAAVEVRTDDTADPAADRQLGFERGVTNRRDVLVDVEIVGDDLFLTRRVALRDFHRLERPVHRIRNGSGAVHRAREPEHLVDDVDVGEEIRDHAGVRLALDMVEHQHRPAVEMLLEAGDFQVRIHGLVGDQQIPLRLEPRERGPQRPDVLLDLLVDDSGHRDDSSIQSFQM